MTTLVRRRGFALVVTLWVLIGGAALAFASAGVARDAIGTTRNRTNQTRAYWVASGCEERARAAMFASLWPEQFTPEVTREAWSTLDEQVRNSPFLTNTHCHIALVPSGLRVDANSVSGPQLRRMLAELRVPDRQTDSLIDALLDWRDADHAARPFGAERDWYEANGRPSPRNAPLAAQEEILSVRGWSELARIARLLGVERQRILWPRADRAVVAALPGMTDEAIAILETRGTREISEPAAIGMFPEMSAGARDTLARNARALIENTTTIPELWTIHAAASLGAPAVRVDIELDVSLANRRLVVTRRVVKP